MKKHSGFRMFFCILLLASVFPAFAGGKKDSLDIPAQTLDSWQETVDISAQKEGKHNIVVTAKDLAGNLSYAGPYNLFVDPASDLPVVRITNPLEDMRVPGNLNIVGTCIDDDAVDYVELIFDGSEQPVRAQGAEFWSYYLDTRTLTEGKHRIDVFGVDRFGVRGLPYSVIWNLDRNRPETSVSNLPMGSLVSGKFSLSGLITDGNGVRRLSYSLDGGKTFLITEIRQDKKTGSSEFSLSINTLKMPDGPAVCWFKAEDGQGSEGIYTYLFFVDNTKPVITLISPGAGESVNGRFSAGGTASDTVSLASLSWRLGKETGNFELVKGNPYWLHEFDISGETLKEIELEITAIDTAGNVSAITRKILVDGKADVPSLTVTSPVAGEKFQGDVRVSGFVIDDDGAGGIWYALDKMEGELFACEGAFGVVLSGIPVGAHSLEVSPVDINGVRGSSLTIPITITGPAPEIRIESPLAPDLEIHPEKGLSVSASIVSPAGLKSASWQITGKSPVDISLRGAATETAIQIPVAADFPYGVVALVITATDIYGRESKCIHNLYISNLSIPRGTAPQFESSFLSSSGDVQLPASGQTPASTGTATVKLAAVRTANAPGTESAVESGPFTNGMAIVLSGASLVVAVESPAAPASATWNLNGGAAERASVVKLGETSFEIVVPLNLKLAADWTKVEASITFRDGSVLSVSGVFCAVRPVPAAGVFDDEQFVWNAQPSSSIKLFDGVKARGLYNGKPGRMASSVRFEKAVPGLEATLSGNEVTVAGKADGEYANVVLVITDSDGKDFRVAPVSFTVDLALPELVVDTSERPVWIQNILPVKITARDSRGIAAAEYSLDGGVNWNLVGTTGATVAAVSLEKKIDVASLPDGKMELLVRATDKSGRSVTDWRVFNKDTSAPEAETVIPELGDTVNGETRIAFKVKESGRIAKAEYRAPGDRSVKDTTQWIPFDLASLPTLMVGTTDKPLAAKMEFRFTDAAGNSIVLASPQFIIDASADEPRVEVHLPAESEVIRKNFLVSGVVYDDDQPGKLWYKIDAGKYAPVESTGSFSIPVALLALTDNEHRITLYAEDIHGVKGAEVVRTIRVSLEEPKAEVISPSLETTNRGVIEISGNASDRNGIEKVEVSLDNGNTYNLASGGEQWKYRFDTRVIQDGTHVVFVRVYDKYGTAGLYSSLVNIDNTAPAIRLELPLDGSRTAETLFVSGQTMDNIGLENVTAKISNMDSKQLDVPSSFNEIKFDNTLIISAGIDISKLPAGFYNLEIRGYDRAGNITRVSRNFEVYRGADRNRIEFLYPLNGESMQGMFNIYGRVVSEDPVESLLLFVDDTDTAVAELSQSGFFKFTIDPGKIADGEHRLTVRAMAAGDKIINSEPHTVFYRAEGPWITIDNFVMEDFAVERPWLSGTTGYSLIEEDVIALRAKETPDVVREALLARTLKTVEISFDNGKTFRPTESGKKWRYRIETGDLPEGYHFLIVRATMKDGAVAVTRSIIQIDKTAPSVTLISPGEGGRYNNEIVFSGLSSDDVQLDSIVFSIRAGDKSMYALPSFIQGLYIDWHFWGATLYDIGIGLTFFSENVKLQAQFGQFTEQQRAVFTPKNMRYGGNVFGLKMLANLAYVPFDFFLGPNYHWLSATAAIGANFSVFSETQSGKAQMLSALLMQIEFPKVTLPKRKSFRTFSLYTELQLWFIPTDVDSSDVQIRSVLPHITGGIRVNVF